MARKPQKQYYGDSEAEYEHYKGKYGTGASNADLEATRGVARSGTAADNAEQRYGRLASDVQDYGREQQNEAGQADQGFDRSMGDYRAGRSGVLANAGRLEADAAGLADTYQQTSDRAFQLNQNRAERAAMAQGARGGASGLRTAIASQTAAGADAAAQAEVTRAQELNQLAQMKQNAYATAAGIRSGQGAQDQGAGQIYAGRQQNAYGNLAGANAQRAGIVGEQFGAQQNAAELQAGTAIAQQGNYLGAETAMNAAQLNASREREQARQQQKTTQYNRWTDPFGTHTAR